MKKFREMLERRFEIKTKVIGAAEEEVREARVLNRVLRIKLLTDVQRDGARVR